METEASETTRQTCGDLQMYIDTLETPASCNSGEPGKLVWTPDENTPDLVYYQVIHVYLLVSLTTSCYDNDVMLHIIFSLLVCYSFKSWLEDHCC